MGAMERPRCIATNTATDGPVPRDVQCTRWIGHLGDHEDPDGFAWSDEPKTTAPTKTRAQRKAQRRARRAWRGSR